MPVQLCVFCGCFHATVVELSHNRDLMLPQSRKYCLALYSKFAFYREVCIYFIFLSSIKS